MEGYPCNPAASAPAESAHRAAIITDIVAIRGGGIPIDQAFPNAWLTQPEEVEGRRFVHIVSTDSRCRSYFNSNFGMVTYIKFMRDRKAMDLMRAAAPQDADPNESNIVAPKLPDRPKRELIDLIPKIIDVEVYTRTRVQATVSVIPSWRDKGALQIELTQENMDLMLEEPPAESAQFNPNLTAYPNAA